MRAKKRHVVRVCMSVCRSLSLSLSLSLTHTHTHISTHTNIYEGESKILNMFYLVIYLKQKVHNDFIFLCSIVLPPVGHSSSHEYHCGNLQGN